MPSRNRSKEHLPDLDTPAGSAEELRARGERVVHTEDMKASVAEVIEEHAHVAETKEPARERPHVVMGGAQAEKSAGEDAHGPRHERSGAKKRAKRIAPEVFRLVNESRDAVVELLAGVRRAKNDLIEGVQRARRCFSLTGRRSGGAAG